MIPLQTLYVCLLYAKQVMEMFQMTFGQTPRDIRINPELSILLGFPVKVKKL